MLYVGVPLALLGLTMMTRGWIYTIWPDGKVAEKRKRRNLKVGFTTDMKLFGRKVRRLGLMLAIAGSGLVGWDVSLRQDAAAAEARATESVAAPAAPTTTSP